MLRIYLDEKALVLAEEKISLPGFIQADPSAKLEAVLKEFLAPENSKDILYHTVSLKKAWTRVVEVFKLIEAAGGLVKNPSGDFLFILRHGKWDLPKGKKERGESYEECAIREVREECGLKNLELIGKLPSTYHIYYLKGKPVIKHSHWYGMYCSEMGMLTPQEEEGITEVRWMSMTEIKNTVLKNTYPSVRDLIGEALRNEQAKF